MGKFRDFVLSPAMDRLHCEVEGCKNPIAHYIVHEIKDHMQEHHNFYSVDYICDEHEHEHKKRFRQRFKEDGVKTRIYEGKIKE